MCTDDSEPFPLPPDDGAESLRNRQQGQLLRHYLGGPAMRGADTTGEGVRRGRLRTPWHAPDSEGSRALCGADGTVMVTDDAELVTCAACLLLLEVDRDV